MLWMYKDAKMWSYYYHVKLTLLLYMILKTIFYFILGYGTIAPKTAGGQIFCMCYALFGIPLNIILLSQIGKRLSCWFESLGKCLLKKGLGKVTTNN